MDKYRKDIQHYRNLYECLLRLDNKELSIIGDRYSETLLSARKAGLPTINVASFWINKYAYYPLSANTKRTIMDFIVLCHKNYLPNVTIYGLFISPQDVIYIQSLGVKYVDIHDASPDKYRKIFIPSNNLTTMIDYGKYIISGHMLSTYDDGYVFVTDMDLLDSPPENPQCQKGEAPYKIYSHLERLDYLGVLAIYRGSSFENNMYLWKCDEVIKNSLYDFVIKFLGDKYIAYLPISIKLDSIDLLRGSFGVNHFTKRREEGKIFQMGHLWKYAIDVNGLLPEDIKRKTDNNSDILYKLIHRIGKDLYMDCYNMMDVFIQYITIRYRSIDKHREWVDNINKGYNFTLSQLITDRTISESSRYYKSIKGIEMSDFSLCLNYETTNYNENIITPFDENFVKDL